MGGFCRFNSPSAVRALVQASALDDQPDLFRLLREILFRFFR